MTKADMDRGTAEYLGAEYFQDPYSVHARLRAQRPVSAVIMPGGIPAWLVTGYAEARAALADPRLRKSPPGWRPDPGSIYAALEGHMLNSDPPDHERLRRLVNKAFTARRVERLRPRIAAITAELLDEMSTEREVDLLAAFAFPLPITVICELVGIPAADRDDFRKWSASIISNNVSVETFQADATAMVHYFMALLAARRQEPADDLLSALILARDEGDGLDENELLSMMFLLLVAGHETTVNLIASGTLALLLNPGQLDRLRGDPALLAGAVEELLRCVNPVNHATGRFAAEPVEIGGAHIKAGEAVIVALSSADRDPSRFADPDRLDLGRDTSGQLAFGHGIHYCLGAPLARLEAEIAFGAAGPVRLDAAGGARRVAALAAEHADPRPGGTAGAARPGPVTSLTEIAPGVFIATSSFALTTTTVVVSSASPGGCLLIDPGVTVAELTRLAAELAERGLTPSAAWSTHPHWDHLLWSAELGAAPRYAAPAAVTVAEAQRDAILDEVQRVAPGHDLSLAGRLRPLDRPAIPWDGPEARLIVHDGHAPGHGAVFLPGSGVLVAGDMCSDVEIPLLDMAATDPVGDYRTGMERLASVAGVRQVVPGHGHAGDAAEFRRRLGADSAYLDAVSAGKPCGDPRLMEGPEWMRVTHEDQVRCFRP